MRFASGLSKREDLSLAVVEAVAEVKASLGHDAVPTFVQVMVSSAYADPRAAPGYVLECFTPGRDPHRGETARVSGVTDPPPPPALFGGVVTGAIGGAGAVVDGFGVSVFAGVMPDVEAVAFAVADASLPSQLTAEQWRRIGGGADDDDESEGARGGVGSRQKRARRNEERRRPPRVAALMLACADFEDVETFTGRLHAAAPGAVVAGAVAKPGGALFSGSGDVSSVPALAAHVTRGAVGVLLAGDFEMETHSLHAHRPVGAPMTLTRAGADGVVLDLDGRAAGEKLAGLLASLPDGVAGMPVMLGMRDDDGDVVGDDEPVANAKSDDDASRANASTSSCSADGDVRDDDATEKSTFPRATPSPRRRGRSAWIRGRVVDDVAENISSEPTVTKKDADEAALITSVPRTDRTTDRDANVSVPRRSWPTRDDRFDAAAEAAAVSAYGAGGAGYVYRDIVGADHETGGVFVGQHALREGSRVQLHVRDAAWGKARVKALLAKIASSERSGNPAGAVMYTCVSGNRMHAGDFREAVAACPLGGGFVAGEIAPAERGARAALQSHTSVVAVFRERARDAAR